MHDEAALDFFFSSRRRHTRLQGDWSSDVCSSDLCLTPGEGHGQGDSVIKDFLEAAYQKSDAAIYDNKKFFRKWTPGRIRVSSFGSAFVTREFVVSVKEPGQEEKRTGRLDLFIVDPQNKLLIAIENKVGADR